MTDEQQSDDAALLYRLLAILDNLHDHIDIAFMRAAQDLGRLLKEKQIEEKSE